MANPVITSFRTSLENENKSIYTVIAYTKDIDQFLSFCKIDKNKDLSQIESQDIDAFVEDLKAKGYTLKSVSRKLNSIKTFYRFAIEKNYVSDNPSRNVSHPKLDSYVPRVLTTQEYRALRDACKKDIRLYSIVELLMQTGMKIGELCRLKIQDVKFKDNYPISLNIEKHESSLPREIPLNSAAAEAVLKYLEIRPKFEGKDSLFLTKTGNPLLMRNIRFYLDRAFKAAGIKGATVNDIRNTFIAHHLAKGTSILLISQVVGHKRVSTTERYANLLGLNKEKSTTLEVL